MYNKHIPLLPIYPNMAHAAGFVNHPSYPAVNPYVRLDAVVLHLLGGFQPNRQGESC